MFFFFFLWYCDSHLQISLTLVTMRATYSLLQIQADSQFSAKHLAVSHIGIQSQVITLEAFLRVQKILIFFNLIKFSFFLFPPPFPAALLLLSAQCWVIMPRKKDFYSYKCFLYFILGRYLYPLNRLCDS